MKKTARFRQLLTTKQLEFVMGAHDALSARIAEEAGFKALWAGGLGMSAAMGVRDCNELSWTQVLEVVEFMSDATNIPIILDADTGYGNYNNVRRLIRKLESRDIAAVCIEDKLFPKSNSFADPEFQELADIDEFCGRIRAAKDVQRDPDFTVIARVEAFIAGLGLEEALKRAEAYRQAGADAILIHSKAVDAKEIESFMSHWDDRCPVLIVPTSYYRTPVSLFETMGVSLVVWSNHLVRASIESMQRVAGEIQQCGSVLSSESQIASMHEVFRLQRHPELSRANKKYLPRKHFMQGYILDVLDSSVKGRGAPSDTPRRKESSQSVKCSAEEALRCVGVSKITSLNVQSSASLSCSANNGSVERWKVALHALLGQISGPAIIVPNTIAFDTGVLAMLRDVPGDIVIVANALESPASHTNISSITSSKCVVRDFESDSTFYCLTEEQGTSDDWIGLIKVTSKGVRHLKRAVTAGWKDNMRVELLFQAALRGGASVRVLEVIGTSPPLHKPLLAVSGR